MISDLFNRWVYGIEPSLYSFNEQEWKITDAVRVTGPDGKKYWKITGHNIMPKTLVVRCSIKQVDSVDDVKEEKERCEKCDGTLTKVCCGQTAISYVSKDEIYIVNVRCGGELPPDTSSKMEHLEDLGLDCFGLGPRLGLPLPTYHLLMGMLTTPYLESIIG